MAFNNQKDGILKFYEATNEFIHQHQETYNKLVNKLNDKVGLTQKLTNNLDDFMENSFPDLNAFKQQINSQPLDDSQISYVFDVNKKGFVSNFNLPEKKIIVKQNFKCVLVGSIDDIGILNNNQPCGAFCNSIQKYNNSFRNNTNVSTQKYNLELQNQLKNGCTCPLTNCCSCNHSVFKSNVITTFFRNAKGYKNKENKSIEFWIDDYFNIYIPLLKTYLVYNYSKFPLYSFYINLDKLNLYHNHIENSVRTIVYNENCPEDLEEYNKIKGFIDVKDDYLSSQDKRNHYKTLFPDLLNFYQYYEKQSYFEQFQTFSEKLEQLAPTTSAKVLVEDEDTMNDEKKIFTQSQRIRELEVNNHRFEEEVEYLRNERTMFIQKDTDINSKMKDYEKLLEELNRQLHEEIDKISNHQKEIIKLKTLNLEYGEIRNKYNRLEGEINNIREQLSNKELQLEKNKTLNNTLIDKQTEIQQKLSLERKSNKSDKETVKELRIEIENNNKKIAELERAIESEKEQHVVSKSKINDILKEMSGKNENIEDDYQEILLTQIKEKTEEIKQLKISNTKHINEVQQTNNKLSNLKSQVSSLLNIK